MKRREFLSTTVMVPTFARVSVAAPAIAQGQIIVVPQASRLAWDYDPAADYVAQFNIYLSRTATIVPDGNPVASVAWPDLEWVIDGQPGRWYGVVTAVGADVDATESGPSNEIAFVVIGPPGNLTVVK